MYHVCRVTSQNLTLEMEIAYTCMLFDRQRYHGKILLSNHGSRLRYFSVFGLYPHPVHLHLLPPVDLEAAVHPILHLLEPRLGGEYVSHVRLREEVTPANIIE